MLSSSFIIFLIIIILISVISLIIKGILIFKYFRSFHMSNSGKRRYRIYIFIWVIIILFIIIFPIVMYAKVKEPFINESDNKNENDIDSYHGNSIEYGRSGIGQSGTIKFKVPFQRVPKVFTQIVGSNSSTNNIYSVQIFDITHTGFNYSKNMISNSTSNSGSFTMPTLSPSNVESFDWIAFG